ncbi:MAG: isoprenylcysteine carboxylmethyltransferase family protein [Pseudomonadota bacterium]
MRNSAAYTQSRTHLENDGATQSLSSMGIDASSWLSWAVYLGTFWTALFLNPQAGLELREGNMVAMALLVSVAFFFGAVLALQRHMRLSLTASSFGQPEKLTTTGVFRWSRNPIYTAFFVPLGTVALVSPVAALTGLIGYVHVMTRFVISHEETELSTKFGAEYAAYKRAVPRWFGSL